METVEYIELFWDCPECGKRHISAVFNSQGNRCPQCLYWRTETIELYEAPDSQVIRDRTLIDRKPFWVCKVCNAVNEDTGLAVDLLQCSNCNSYQTSGVGDITGDVESDRKAPDLVAVGEPVPFQEALANNPSNLDNAPSKKKINPIKAGLMAILAVGGISGIWLSQQSTSPQVRVTDLQWTTEVDLQQQETFTHQGWDELVPSGASIVRSQTKQRDTRQQQQGSRTIFLEERYQSGTHIETYTTSERYQSGTRSETYTTSERYQSGSKQECKTTSLGNGLGKRTCRDIPVYSTRQVPRTRTVPVYSTRQIPRTRTVPIYSTRKVPVQEPIYVTLPVYDQWVTYQVKEWVTLQTYNRTGRDNTPTLPLTVKLSQQVSQRLSSPRTTCRLYGTYEVKDNWLQSSKLRSSVWVLPCQEYDLIDIGDRIPFLDLAPKKR